MLHVSVKIYILIYISMYQGLFSSDFICLLSNVCRLDSHFQVFLSLGRGEFKSVKNVDGGTGLLIIFYQGSVST